MKNIQGLTPLKSPMKNPAQQGYMGYLTQKQLQQLNKYKREQESDRDSVISGHSNKGRRMKLRHVQLISICGFKMSKKSHFEIFLGVA